MVGENRSQPPTVHGDLAGIRVLYVVERSERNPLLNSLVDHLHDRVMYTVAVLDDGDGPMLADLRDRRVAMSALRCTDKFKMVSIGPRDLRGVVRTTDPHLIQSNGFGSATVVERCLAGEPRPIPWLLARHYNLEHIIGRHRLAARFDRRHTKRSTHIIAVSEAVRTTLVTLEGVESGKVTVVPNGIDWSAVRVSPDKVLEWKAELGSPLAVAIGRLDPLKDYPTVLRALHLVRAAGWDLSLAIAGSGPEHHLRKLRDLAESLKVRSAVRFLGWRANVFDLVAAADIFVQASLDESFGQAVLEAIGLGVPVAVTTPGGVKEIVGGWYPALQPSDANLLARQMISVLEAPAQAAEVARSASADVRRRFTASAMAEGHLRVYRSLLVKNQ